MNPNKIPRFAQAAATGLMGFALSSTAFAETGVPPQSNAAKPQAIAPLASLQSLIQGGDKDNIRWKLRVAAQVRKHLQAEAPDLVPGYDRMVLELALDSRIENVIERMGREFKNASPETRQRVIALAEARVSDMLPGIKDQIVAAATGISAQLETRAPDLAPGYDQVLRELAAEPGLEKLVDRLRNEWAMASVASRQGIVRQIGLIAGDLAPEIGKVADMAAAEVRKQLDRRAPDLVTGYDEIVRELAAESSIERAVRRLPGFWDQASPELRTRILGIVGEMVADLIPEIEAHAETAVAGIRERMENRTPELVPLYNEALREITSEPALRNLAGQAGKEFRNASPEMRRRIIELVGSMVIDLMNEVTKG